MFWCYTTLTTSFWFDMGGGDEKRYLKALRSFASGMVVLAVPPPLPPHVTEHTPPSRGRRVYFFRQRRLWQCVDRNKKPKKLCQCVVSPVCVRNGFGTDLALASARSHVIEGGSISLRRTWGCDLFLLSLAAADITEWHMGQRRFLTKLSSPAGH